MNCGVRMIITLRIYQGNFLHKLIPQGSSLHQHYWQIHGKERLANPVACAQVNFPTPQKTDHRLTERISYPSGAYPLHLMRNPEDCIE